MATKRKQKLSGKSRTVLSDYIVSEFLGTNTFIKDITSLQDGETPDSLNWLTSKYKDNIQLRRGYALLGTTRQTGNGQITGLDVGEGNNGTQVPFFTYGRKIKYYNATTGDTAEVSTTNILPAAASNDFVSVMPYQNIAGSFVYFTSPNSSIYKAIVSSPQTVLDMQSQSFKGIANIQQNRMAMWQRKDAYGYIYANTLYIGVSDKATISQYTQTTKESIGTGDGSTKTFTGTLAFQSSNSKATAFNIEIAAPIATGIAITGITAATQAVITTAGSTAGFTVGSGIMVNGVVGMTQINNLIGIVSAVTATTVTTTINSSTFSTWTSGGNMYVAEYFVDDTNGNLSSAAGGTGTINYGTGAFSVTFNTAPINTQNIYAQYYTEDATSGGVADFTQSSTTGQGKTFNQMGGGGDIQSVFPFDQVLYCFHLLKTWYLTLTTDDANATNLPYRSDIGTPFFKAGYPTDDGIVYVDMSNPNNPKVQTLEISTTNASAVVSVVPSSLSDMLDLTTYGFAQAVVQRWGDYDLVSFAGSLGGVVQKQNTLTYARNRFTGQWDLLDYAVSAFARYNGTLLAGDSLSNNVYTLFSGFDDDGNVINNFYNTKQYDLGVQGLKKFHIFHIRGLIQLEQNLDINLSFDGGNFITIFTVNGRGSYVSNGKPQEIGAVTIGSAVEGGNGSVVAYPFEIDIPYVSSDFEYVQVQFAAQNIGFVQVDEYGFKDCRYKGRHILPANTIVN